MFKRLSILLWILLAAGCGPLGAPYTNAAPLTQKELDTLPSDEIGRRVALQLNLTIADDPNFKRRYGLNERRDPYGVTLQGQGYKAREELCRRDVLRVRYVLRPPPNRPARSQGFESEATFARLKDYPGVVDCADGRLVFFRVDLPKYVTGEDVAQRVMGLFDRARAFPTEGSMDCGDMTGKRNDCRTLLAGLPVSHIRKVLDCEPQNGGLCGMLYLDDWTLTINSNSDGKVATVRLVVVPNL